MRHRQQEVLQQALELAQLPAVQLELALQELEQA
jgi:hypothetical protein